MENDKQPKEESELNDKPQEMDVRGGPGSIVGIAVIILIIVIAGVYMFISRTNTPSDNVDDIDMNVSDEDITPEAITDEMVEINNELDALDQEILNLEAEFDDL